MSGLGCEKGILFMKLDSSQKGSDLGENQALGPSLFLELGESSLVPSCGVDGPIRRGQDGHEWASNHTP